MGLFSAIADSLEARELKKYNKKVDKILSLEGEYSALSDDELKAKTDEFKTRLKNGETLDDILPEAFATVRETAFRVLGMKHFPVQLLGGMVLHEGSIAEMKTGEGKTLTATLAVYLNALSGNGVHVVTVNDYLASRDSQWMGQIYTFLGLSVGLNINGLTAAEKREAYLADITYGTNSEFGFDYLRDNMVVRKEDLVQRELSFAVIDEVDSILIDEARTPLIISGKGTDNVKAYSRADKFAAGLKADVDYTVEAKGKTVTLTEEGATKAERFYNVTNLSDLSNMEIMHNINQALKARYIMRKDVDYVVQNGQVVIVDEFTGRFMPGRRFNDGLHQAIEAKERVNVAQESVTVATITLQNYFRMYSKLCGMTGTAKTEEREFSAIYGMKVVCVPTNKPMIRQDLNDLVFRTEKGKFNAVVSEIKRRHATGQPILVGTISIEKSELLSTLLKRSGIAHNVLNAKNHKREAEIIAQAGQMGAVTISTNMAGRGTDIVLGEGVKELGGLHIIGTERHESRRIDNQLRGRAGRQGDPGSSQFYLSLEDDLLRRFGSDMLQSLADKAGFDGDVPLEMGMLSKSIETAQKNVEARNFNIRKHVLQYDDVMNKHREIIYSQRRQVLEGEDISETINGMIKDMVSNIVQTYTVFADPNEPWDIEKLSERFERTYGIKIDFEKNSEPEQMERLAYDKMLEGKNKKEEEIGSKEMRNIERAILLLVVDNKWMDHIDNMEQLKQGIGLRAYAQTDPVQAFTSEGSAMFDAMNDSIIEETVRLVYNFKIKTVPVVETGENTKVREVAKNKQIKSAAIGPNGKPISKNSKCPCGSGKKYKQCCGKDLFRD